MSKNLNITTILNAIIIDNDAKFIKNLIELINSKCPNIEIVAEAENLENGFKLIETLQPEILFLDADLPNVNVFEKLKNLTFNKYSLIVLSKDDIHALPAIKSSAIDYLIKPVKTKPIKKAINKVNKIHSTNTTSNVLTENKEKKTSDEQKQNIPNQKISLPFNNGHVLVKVNDIVRLESESNYTNVFFTDQTSKLISKTTKEFEKILDTNIFVRIHKSHVINLNHLEKYTRVDGGTATMIDGTKVIISRRRFNEFLSKLDNYAISLGSLNSTKII